MDPPSLDKVFHQELIRRSLIAISQLDPDTILSSEKLPDQSTSAVADQNGGSTVDEYRAKLISISYMQSPNAWKD